jgi:hypothetical protein
MSFIKKSYNKIQKSIKKLFKKQNRNENILYEEFADNWNHIKDDVCIHLLLKLFIIIIN